MKLTFILLGLILSPPLDFELLKFRAVSHPFSVLRSWHRVRASGNVSEGNKTDSPFHSATCVISTLGADLAAGGIQPV